MNSGSRFLVEIIRTISSLSPRGNVSASTSVTKPYWYSFSVRSWMVLVEVFMPFLFLSRSSRAALRPGAGDPRRGRAGQGAGYFRERDAAQRLANGRVDFLPVAVDRANRRLGGSCGAVHRGPPHGQRPLRRGDDVGDGNLLGTSRQTVTPFDAPMRDQKTLPRQRLQGLVDHGEREVRTGGEI